MNTLIQHLHRARAATDTLAYLQAGSRSYADFYQAVSQHAQYLRTMPATAWALWCDDSYQFAVDFFALLLAGKTVVLPPNRITATVDSLAALDIHYWDSTEHSAAIQNHVADAWPELDWQQAPVVFYTSGSTGTPKRIERTFGQLQCEIDVLHALFPWPAHTTVFATVSHQHLFGLCYKILLPLQQGAAFVNEQSLYPEDLQRLYQHYQPDVSVLISSPAFLSRWQEPQAACKYLQVFSSGGPLPANVPTQLQRDIVEIFGSSESGGIAWRHAPQAWQVFPNVRIRVDDTQQLWLQTEHAHTPEWMATGDAARLLPEHSFELLGRLDRMVKLEEKRLSLDAIELPLRAHELIDDVHVCVLQNAGKQQLAAVCTLTETAWQQLREQGKYVFVQALKRSLRTHLESIAIPKRWRFVPELPRNSQSKLNRAAIVDMFALHKRPVSQVLHADEHHAELRLWFPPELQCFQGHFPGLPIYPGVAQLDLVQHHIRSLLLPEHVCTGVEQLKFQQPIRPYDEVTLQLQRSDAKVQFKLLRGDTPLASGRLYFEEAAHVQH
ncbi:AMP-binding protein [Vitreoscilla massiliensis]|uniref:AMP-binding protein n=1 Tax=Vitreoscilla massiliensis TaxID=1689272 RepID=A0ABY4E2M0_9NEIS|nr:AMP-binding protein [Vitreoscilla massiliensis]UOO90026.1 AMP-binding protein [Vitreoscilla massiliensis]